MNRNYKVIWNQSLNCFMAVAEYAKSRGKSSGSAVTSSTTVSSGSVVANGMNILRWSAVCTGLIAAGFSMQATAFCATGDAIDCGAGAAATGSSSIALGQNAKATAGQSIAIGGVDGGQFTTASGDQSIALGANVVSSGSSSIAIGGDDLNQASRTNVDENGTVTSTGTNNNVGNVNTAFRKYSGRDLVGTPQFPNTAASGQASVAIGVQSVSSGALSTAFGTQTKATGLASAAFGVSANASKEGSVAIGAGAATDKNATSEKSIIINGVTYNFAGNVLDSVNGPVKTGAQVSVGSAGFERQIRNVAGGKISTDSTDAINGSQLAATNSALTVTNTNVNTNTTSITNLTNGTAGLVKQANGTAPITVGAQTGGTSVSLAGTAGNRVLSGVAAGIASTDAANVSQLKTSSVIAGKNTTVSSAVAGNNTAYTVNTEKSTVSATTGSGLAVTSTKNATDVTDYAVELNAATKTSLGKADSAIQTITSTSGNLVATKTGDSVSLDLSMNPNFTTVTTTGKVKAGDIVLNSATGQINGLTAGTLADDAATVGQVTASNDKINQLGGNSASHLGGGATYNATTGAITAPSYQLDKGTVTATNVGGALTNLDGRISTNTDNIGINTGNIIKAKTTVTKGDNIEVTSSTNTDGSTNYQVATAKNLTVDSIKAGNSTLNSAGVTITDGTKTTTVSSAGTNVTDGINSSTYGANGLSITGGPSITTTGIDAGNKKITGVLAGSTATDAVNYEQLSATNANVATNTTNIADNSKRSIGNLTALGGGAKYDTATDTYTAPTYALNGGTESFNTVGGALGNLDTRTTKNTGDIAANAGNIIKAKSTVSQGENILVTETKDSVTGASNYEVKTARALNLDSVTTGNSKLDTAGLTITGGPSITTIGIDAGNKKITGVLAGSTATDAVNYEQLTGLATVGNDKINQLGGNSASHLGGGATYNATTGAITAPSYQLDKGTVTATNVGGALTNLDGRISTNTDNIGINTGNIIGLTNGTAGIVRQAARTGAITVGGTTSGTSVSFANSAGANRVLSGVGAGVADNDAVNFSQLKAVTDKIDNSNIELNNAAVQYDKNPDSTINKESITLGGGTAGTTITNVKSGAINATSTDAINGSQLHNLGSGVASIIGSDATYDANGNLTANNIGGTGKGNISDAIAAVNQGNAQANESIKANTDSIKTNANNIKANNDSIKANTDDIKANTNRLNSGLSFGADSGNDINKSVGDSTALKFEGGNNITTTATGNGIKFDLNGNISVDSVTTGNTKIDTSGVTIKDGPSMTVDGIYAGDKTITGVADGIEVKDAVNFGQLNALDKRLGNSINELGYKIGEVEDGANAGISAAMAMSSLPQAYIPGKSMVGGGIATYNGQSAVAVGVSKVSDNGRWVIKANGTADTQGNAGGAIGAGFHF